MAQRIVIDPVTRIEGHLRLEAEVDGARHRHRIDKIEAFKPAN